MPRRGAHFDPDAHPAGGSLPLFDAPHDGETYEPEFDKARLGRLLRLTYEAMEPGGWMTIPEIREIVGAGTESSISARIRDLRKDKFGAHKVDRRRRGDPSAGVWEYRLVRN